MKTLTTKSRENLEKMVNTSEKKLNQVVDALTKEVECYGFSGSIELKLVVRLNNEAFNEEYAIIERSTKLNFQK